MRRSNEDWAERDLERELLAQVERECYPDFEATLRELTQVPVPPRRSK